MNNLVLKQLKKTRFGKYVRSCKNKKERINLCTKLSKELEVNDKQVIFSTFQGRAYSCSPKAIYEYMINSSEFSDYQFIWAFNQPNDKAKYFKDDRTKIVKSNSEEFFYYLYSSKYWVFNFKTPEFYIKTDKNVFLQCWHGTPLKKLGMDIEKDGNAGSSLQKVHSSYLEDAKKYDYFISPSRYCTEKFISSFGLNVLNKEDVIIEQGYPRNDFLFNYSEEDLLRIRRDLQIPDAKKIILYAPTFRDNLYTKGVGHTYELGINLLRLKEELSDEYVLLLRLHYFVANQIDISQFKGFAYNVSSYDDINELYVISDMLVTDYSSVFFDYTNLNKPVLFYMYDLEEYKNDIRDFYIDLEELPGPIYTAESKLIDAIKNISDIQKEFTEKYKEFKKKFNYLEDGQATKRVVEEVMYNEKKDS